jgi:hypothetical protein
MKRITDHVPLFLVAVLAVALIAGCDTCNTCLDGYEHDRQAPAVPTGVGSITGDGYVVVYWNPVYEDDLAGYGVYRSRFEQGPYARIGEVARDDETRFVDEDLTNGVTYFYAVDAFDYNGNESDLNYETVDDTPRPEGWNLLWYSKERAPGTSGIAILPEESSTILVLPFNHADAQYYLGHDLRGCLRIVPLRDAYGAANLIQDYGYTYSEDDADVAPTEGWSSCADGVEVILNHTYILKTSTGYYGKIRVSEISSEGIVVYWAFQIQRWSTELAPPRGASPKRG